MKNMSIKYVILSAVGVLIAITVAVGALGIYTTSHAVALLEGASLRDARQQAMIGNIMLRMEVNRSQVLQALQHSPATEYAKMHDHPLSVHFTAVAQNTHALRKDWDEFFASLQTEEAKALVKNWYEKSNKLGIDSVTDAAKAIEEEKWDDAEKILITQINPGYKNGQEAYLQLQDFLGKRGRANAAKAHEDITSQNYLMIGAILLGAVFAIGAALLLLHAIIKPLQQAVGVARKVAQGDLMNAVETDSRNEFGQLLHALRDMNASLADIVGQVRSGTDTIATASTQIASGNMDLSSRTEQQASALEETASSLEELTSTVRQNADNARQANHLAKSASEVAVTGGAVVSQVVETMGAINESARKIVDIITVIDGIAFQTNILALNAAVEAARAGEQGRGFAVVATEVRNLAHRSAAAAKEIKALINDSVEKADNGSKLVDQAGTTMHDIVHGIRHVSDIMEEITAASQEQTAGIEQIHRAVSQMDQVTQQNAALVEEAASAAQSLRDEASGLAHMVRVFKLAERQAAPARPALPAAAVRSNAAAARVLPRGHLV
ncbi:methyl-accepting chemotaxis protein [Noviherbaspirillum autotrophicum]|uniref:Chemotaxis protein n=1 Tax=Noviherbaspirillum autotrophicum TaxID=709839 RepID=A0A0C2BRB1_9BURK|nr:methyl-accepting chemotaxis protein [Noviherbaspirillum autotrophicum]KIF83805.1 hypothetical protein TSA66_16855 [Noviherbaspirillum autotrophicum]